METKQAIEKFKTDLASAKSEGKTEIAVEALEQYLDHLDSEATTSFQYLNLEHAKSLAHYDAVNAQSREMFKSVIAAGKDAINSSIIINGGAVVVIMAFLGNAISKAGDTGLILRLTNPLLYFGSGVFLGGLGFSTRYVSQFLYGGEWRKTGHIFNALSWIVVIASLVTFVVGVYSTYVGIVTGLNPIEPSP